MTTDPMNDTMGAIETGFVNLKPVDKLRVIIRNPEIETYIDEASGQAKRRLVTPLETTEKAENTNGDTMEPGYVIRQSVLLDTVGKMRPDMIKTSVASLFQAVEGKACNISYSAFQREPQAFLPRLADKTVDISVGLSKPNKETGKVYQRIDFLPLR